jgi:hypothetical protein
MTSFSLCDLDAVFAQFGQKLCNENLLQFVRQRPQIRRRPR